MKQPRNAQQGVGNPSKIKEHIINSPVNLGGVNKKGGDGNRKYMGFRRRLRRDLCR
jgi:hypothetical protein